jgi:hypothetical protein
MPYNKWLKEELLPINLAQYVFDHISIMAKLHAENRYDRLTSVLHEYLRERLLSFQDSKYDSVVLIFEVISITREVACFIGKGAL